jgi:hypothetical protein
MKINGKLYTAISIGWETPTLMTHPGALVLYLLLGKYYHTRAQLEISAYLKIWQVSACKSCHKVILFPEGSIQPASQPSNNLMGKICLMIKVVGVKFIWGSTFFGGQISLGVIFLGGSPSFESQHF